MDRATGRCYTPNTRLTLFEALGDYRLQPMGGRRVVKLPAVDMTPLRPAMSPQRAPRTDPRPTRMHSQPTLLARNSTVHAQPTLLVRDPGQ